MKSHFPNTLIGTRTVWNIALILICFLFNPPSAGQSPHPTAAPIDAADPEANRAPQANFGPGATASFRGENGMVTSSCLHATAAGIEILRSGGNAFDAAVAVQLALNVTEPYASGIGGGLFALGHVAKEASTFNLDAREEAPSGFTIDDFKVGDRLPPFRQRATGGISVGTPGTLAACFYLLEHYGTLDFATVAAPAISLAQSGFIVSEIFADNLTTHWQRISQFPETQKLFSNKSGEPLAAGDRHYNPNLANTLKTIAAQGSTWFYHGELAREIESTVNQCPVRPGKLSRSDLNNYRCVLRPPIQSQFHGHQIVGMNMPSSGGVTLALMLNLLEHSNYDVATPLSPQNIKTLIDVQNLAFADRNRFTGDADFVNVPISGLLDPKYAMSRAKMIKPDTILATPIAPGQPDGAPSAESLRVPDTRESESTTHFVVADRQGNIACITSTIEQHFGSGLTVPKRGFLLNNELTDFDSKASDQSGFPSPNVPLGHPQPRRTAQNEAATGQGQQRPRSSMTPTLVFKDGQPVLALGSPGGSRIIGVTFNTLVNILLHQMDPQVAINQPRVIARNGIAELEPPLFKQAPLLKSIEQFAIQPREVQAAGCVQAIQITPNRTLLGAADPRREGVALGF